MKERFLKCPYCNYESDECDFPDLFYEDSNNSPELNRQWEMAEEIWALGYNIVTCGQCGKVFIQRLEH